MKKESSPLTALNSIIDQVTQEWTQLQIVGRPLTPEEMARSEALAQVLEHLRAARALMANGTPPDVTEGVPRSTL